MAETMAGAGSRIPNDVDVVGTGVFRLRTLMVNVYLVAVSGSADWVLIDAGIRGYARTIERAARTLFGSRPPLGILLTHAHFDHVGSLRALLRRWDVPVHAHMLEFPYLTGRLSYPPPDPTVGGGAMARLSFLYPRGPIDISAHLLASVPHGTYVECFHPDRDPIWWNLPVNRPTLRDGKLALSDAPGLGWELNHDFVDAHTIFRRRFSV